jgi:hypothetical protein
MPLFRKDPFTLMAFHRVLISTAALGALFYGGWELYRNSGHDPGGAILRSTVAFLIAVGFIVYLYRIRGRR